ncbi:MAG: TrmH family RNA methyltransferase, partial [Acidimicrobiales bacterium]
MRELLVAGRRRVHEVWVARVDDERLPVALADIVELAADQRVPVRYVGRTKLSAQTRTEAPQGVVARAAPLQEADLGELARTGRNGQPPFLLAVDGVTDPGNLGALLRAAECNGVSGVVLPRHRAVHVTPA